MLRIHLPYLPVKEIESCRISANQIQFINNGSRQAFLFHLLSHIPLHEVVGAVVLLFQTQIHNIIDALTHRLLMLENTLKDRL